MESLGVQEEHKEEHKQEHKETKTSPARPEQPPEAGGNPAPQAEYAGMSPAEVMAICQRPVAWCAHVGLTLT